MCKQQLFRYKQVAAMRLRTFKQRTFTTNSSPLRGLKMCKNAACYKQAAATRLRKRYRHNIPTNRPPQRGSENGIGITFLQTGRRYAAQNLWIQFATGYKQVAAMRLILIECHRNDLFVEPGLPLYKMSPEGAASF